MHLQVFAQPLQPHNIRMLVVCHLSASCGAAVFCLSSISEQLSFPVCTLCNGANLRTIPAVADTVVYFHTSCLPAVMMLLPRPILKPSLVYENGNSSSNLLVVCVCMCAILFIHIRRKEKASTLTIRHTSREQTKRKRPNERGPQEGAERQRPKERGQKEEGDPSWLFPLDAGSDEFGKA